MRYVPQAIDSVKTETLRAYGTNDLGQALSGIPNVSSGADTRFDSLRIRGFDASNDFYLDGIRDDSQYIRDLHNIERIEVLKGPAAVLYGRGGQGGIVNRVSKLPTAGHKSSIEAQGGSNDLRSVYADLSTDPTDNISLRLPYLLDQVRLIDEPHIQLISGLADGQKHQPDARTRRKAA